MGDWTKSSELNFNVYSPIPMTQFHPVFHAQMPMAWNNKALLHSKGGNTPFFSLHWGYSQDYPCWARFWNQSLTALTTFFCSWGQLANLDFTDSPPTFYLRRLMSQVRPREKFFLDLMPVQDYQVGVYHPDLDWQEIHSHPAFFLRAQGPNAPMTGQLGKVPMGIGYMGTPVNQVYDVLVTAGYAAQLRGRK